MPTNATKTDDPIVFFPSPAEWRKWLKENHASHSGVWLRMYKKATKVESPTYAEALDEALCYGWIDGQKKSYDEDSWIQRFVPRRPKSAWSKINRDHIERLSKAGKMRKAGLDAVEAAKADGRWDAAYDSPSNASIPKDFQKALDASPKAKAFYETLKKTNTYAILHRIQNAKKPETRARKIETMIAMLENNEKIHP